MKIIITGICGTIGHHVCEHFLRNTDWDIIGVDNLSYASLGYDRLRDIEAFDDKRVKLVGWDISYLPTPGIVRELQGADFILHLAAETHVDRSIEDPLPFVTANVLGMQHMINLLRDHLPTVKLMVNFSTDEVFGPAPVGVYYSEHDKFNPQNPYASTKAAAVHLCDAAINTHKLPICTTFTMNVFAERQTPEKFIPLCINKVISGDLLEIHADETKTISGSR